MRINCYNPYGGSFADKSRRISVKHGRKEAHLQFLKTTQDNVFMAYGYIMVHKTDDFVETVELLKKFCNDYTMDFCVKEAV